MEIALNLDLLNDEDFNKLYTSIEDDMKLALKNNNHILWSGLYDLKNSLYAEIKKRSVTAASNYIVAKLSK